MFRKKSLLASGTGLTVTGGAEAGPAPVCISKKLELEDGGCLAMNAGSMMKNRQITIGSTVNRFGFRQQKV